MHRSYLSQDIGYLLLSVVSAVPTMECWDSKSNIQTRWQLPPCTYFTVSYSLSFLHFGNYIMNNDSRTTGYSKTAVSWDVMPCNLVKIWVTYIWFCNLIPGGSNCTKHITTRFKNRTQNRILCQMSKYT